MTDSTNGTVAVAIVAEPTKPKTKRAKAVSKKVRTKGKPSSKIKGKVSKGTVAYVKSNGKFRGVKHSENGALLYKGETLLIGQGRLILSYNPDEKETKTMLCKLADKASKAGVSFKAHCKAVLLKASK